MQIVLRKLIARKQISASLDAVLEALDESVQILDVGGTLLKGAEGGHFGTEHPIVVNGERIGTAVGNAKAAAVAILIAQIATAEFEKKTLARETLDRYKELSLLYSVAEKLTTCLTVQDVARMAIEEAARIIPSSYASVMLFRSASSDLETICTLGQNGSDADTMKPGEGIAGNVYQNGKAEIVNDVESDPRRATEIGSLRSMMCAPLRTNEKAIGVIKIGSHEHVDYASGDLKLFTALSLQAASAIENAQFHENMLKEERIKSHLERYIAPQIVNAILAEKGDIPLVPARRNIAILFSDIRNFSAKCEEMLPEKIVGYLNEYFSSLVDIIFSHGGTLNKFVGDMMFAFFGAPSGYADNEIRSIESAIEMQKSIREIPNGWIRENFQTGIGISCGDVVVGNIGSPKHLDYTAIGDEVNVADRLQSLAKGGEILVSGKIYKKTQGLFSFRECGDIKVKGRKQIVEAYEVLF